MRKTLISVLFVPLVLQIVAVKGMRLIMENFEYQRDVVLSGKAILGIELGSTRIKAVLIDEQNNPIVSGGYNWQNSLLDDIWTYSLEDALKGVSIAYSDMVRAAKQKLDVEITDIASIGISGMMHGYLVFDRDDNLLVPFRTWRNNITEHASKELTGLFNYPIPQRWSVAHLYQCILNGDEHVKDINFITTLAGYVHWKLTNQKKIGVGDASGMFPIATNTKSYNTDMIKQFDEKISDRNYNWRLGSILPEVCVAGYNAGELTHEGALILDPSGKLRAGIPLCPPEGDAGTGMVATNSIGARMGNVSAGTSVFACVVLEKDLSKAYAELDQVTTPDGKLVAMAHSNNCTSDLNAWVNIFKEAIESLGAKPTMDEIYGMLYNKALEGDADCGGLLSYGYISGEHMTHFEHGRPLFVRSENANFNLANFMRSHLFTALGAMRIGLDILFEDEKVKVDEILGHGGLFKTKGVGQKIMAAATNAPVTVMETASEGGAWGVALLASYMINKQDGQSLDDFLKEKVFKDLKTDTIEPDEKDVVGYNEFMKRYKKGLDIERAAVDNI